MHICILTSCVHRLTDYRFVTEGKTESFKRRWTEKDEAPDATASGSGNPADEPTTTGGGGSETPAPKPKGKRTKKTVEGQGQDPPIKDPPVKDPLTMAKLELNKEISRVIIWRGLLHSPVHVATTITFTELLIGSVLDVRYMVLGI